MAHEAAGDREVMRALCTIAIALALTLGASPATSQTFQGSASQDPKLSKRDAKAVVTQLAELMSTSYVDSAIGVRAARLLRDNAKQGAYSGFATPRPLIAKLTADVQSVIADAHFNILYFPPASAGFSWVSQGEGDVVRDSLKALDDAREQFRPDNYGVARAEILEGNIGWLTLTHFRAPLPLYRAPLAAAFEMLRNTDALIIDVRKNPGGNPECVELAVSYFLDGPALLLNTMVTRGRAKRDEYWSDAQPGGPKYLGGRPVYLLTGPATGSGGEMFAYQLKNHGRATLVGEVTSGAAHSFETFKIGAPEVGNVMVLLPNARGIDALTGGDWEKTGVTPHVASPLADAPGVATRRALDSLLAIAPTPEAKAGYRNQIEKLTYAEQHTAPTAAELERYTGRYGIRRVFVEDGRLRMQRENGPPVDLDPVGEHTFEANVSMTPRPRVRFELAGAHAGAIHLQLPGGEERVARDR